jgi:hypothetical protein
MLLLLASSNREKNLDKLRFYWANMRECKKRKQFLTSYYYYRMKGLQFPTHLIFPPKCCTQIHSALGDRHYKH